MYIYNIKQTYTYNTMVFRHLGIQDIKNYESVSFKNMHIEQTATCCWYQYMYKFAKGV